jgi:glycosyltransferase involved in cell wall biosynthesis
VLTPSPPNSPLFTIITVCLNAGPKLTSTVQSVTTQTWNDYELIVKDGLSNDCSVELLPNSDKIKIIRSKDHGIYDAMNQALSCAKGDYVMFLNAGDLFSNTRVLETVQKDIEANGYCPLLYGDYHNAEFACTIRSPYRLRKRFLYRNMLCHQACFVARSVFDSLGGFDTSFKLLADYDMLARILIEHSLSYRHMGVEVSNYQGSGITRRPESLCTGRLEMERIRNHYFSRAERFCFRTAYAFTLPGLRNWLMNSPRCKRLWPLYVRLANVYNRVSSGRTCTSRDRNSM